MLRQSGGMADYTALSRECDRSRPTGNAHLEAMCVACALTPVPPFDGGSRREVVERPRVYAFECEIRPARLDRRSLDAFRDAYPRGRSFGRGHARHRQTLAVRACIAYHECMQYTIRGVSPAVDQAIRRRARSTGASLNQAANDALAEGVGVARDRPRRDLGDVAGTWKKDRAIEAALAAQDAVDEDLWR